MRTKLPIALITTLLLAACGSGGGEPSAEDKARVMQGRIAAMEDSLFTSTGFDRRAAQELFDVYKAYVAAYPVDSMAPDYLFRSAGLAKVLYEPQQGIFIYDKIMQDYGGWERVPDVMYMKAFTLDSEMGMKGEAQQAYQEVIHQFPDHAFAHDARVMLENLHLTDAELIERFKQMERENEASAGQ